MQRGEREQMRPYSLFSLTEEGKRKVGNSTMKVTELGNAKKKLDKTFASLVYIVLIFNLFVMLLNPGWVVAFLSFSVPYATTVPYGGGGAIDERAMSSPLVLRAAEWWDV